MSWRRWSLRRRVACWRSASHAVDRDAPDHRAALRHQLRRQGLFERRQAAGLQRSLVAGHAGGQRITRRQREHARGVDRQRLRHHLALLDDLLLDLFARAQRVGQRVDLVQHHEALERAAVEVLAPDLEVGLGHAGVGAEDEHRGVRRRQQAERQLGLGTDRVQARRVDHHQAALEQRMRIVDQRVAPCRHLDLAVGPLRRVVFRVFVVPETELTRFLERHLRGALHLAQRLGQLRRFHHGQLDALPHVGALAQLGQRHGAQPRVDRQQRHARRLLWIPRQLDRTHRRAARRGRQNAAPGVGEEDRVDQFGLAARKLGDERQHEPIAGQALAQRIDLRRGRRIAQFMVDQEYRELLDRAVERAAPIGQCVQAARECGSH